MYEKAALNRRLFPLLRLCKTGYKSLAADDRAPFLMEQSTAFIPHCKKRGIRLTSSLLASPTVSGREWISGFRKNPPWVRWYHRRMKRSPWVDPVKNRPAKAATFNTKGDFHKFTEVMRKIVNKKEAEPKPASASHDSDAS